MAWKSVDQDIYSGTCVSAWTSIDLSSIVGSNIAICLFAVSTDVNGKRVAIRRNGSLVDPVYGDASNHGMQYTRTWSGNWQLIACTTSSTGIIEHAQDSVTGNITIRLLGYNVLSNPGPVTVDSAYIFADSGWSDYDISLQQGDVKALAFMLYGRTAGSSPFAVRSPGDTRDQEYIGDSSAGGANRGVTGASGKTGCLVCVETDDDGVYQHAQPTPFAPDGVSPIYWEGSEINDYVPVNQVHSDVIYTNDTWQDLDLSTLGITGRVLCLLKFENGATGTQEIKVNVRRKGETRDFAFDTTGYGPGYHRTAGANDRAGDLLVETNDDGVVDLYTLGPTTINTSLKTTVVGYIASGPQVSSIVHTYLNLRVNFSAAMKDDVELRDVSNYQITVDDPTTAYDFEGVEVIPEEGVSTPSYVDIVMTDCTGGKNYNLEIDSDKLQSDGGLFVGATLIPFVGVTEDPNILAVESISLTEIRVTFSKIMAVNEELKNPSNYTFTGGLNVISVAPESNSSVILTTTQQTPSEIYDLTVS